MQYDSDISIPDIYPSEMESYVHTKTCIQMFTAPLFIMNKNWEEPRGPSTDEQISKLYYVVHPYNGTPFGAKKKKLLIHRKKNHRRILNAFC